MSNFRLALAASFGTESIPPRSCAYMALRWACHRGDQELAHSLEELGVEPDGFMDVVPQLPKAEEEQEPLDVVRFLYRSSEETGQGSQQQHWQQKIGQEMETGTTRPFGQSITTSPSTPQRALTSRLPSRACQKCKSLKVSQAIVQLVYVLSLIYR